MAQTDGDTKKRLLAVALEIVDSEGVSGLTIRKIAERAGVTVSVVHHHYLNKQGLVDACKTTFFDGLAPIVGGIVAGVATRPLPQTIERAVREIWSYARSHVALVRVVAADAAADGQLIEEYRSYEDRPFLAAATSVLAPALGLSDQATRARVHSMGVLVTRFAVSTGAELMALLGASADTASQCAEDELVAIAKLMFLGRVQEVPN